MGSIKYYFDIACLSIVTMLLCLGCKDDNTIGGSTSYIFINRPCDEIYLSHYVLKDTKEQYPDNWYYYPERIEGSVNFGDFLLRVDVAGEDFSFGRVDGETLPADKTIEDQLIRNYLRKSSGSGLQTKGVVYFENIAIIEYRTEAVKDIDVVASEPLFARAAGESLKDLMEIKLMPAHHYFMFSPDKRYIGAVEQGTPLVEYLKYGPLMAASMFLRFREVPESVPSSLSFTVRIKMATGEVLSAESPEITLK